MKKILVLAAVLLCSIPSVRAAERAVADTTSGKKTLDQLEGIVDTAREKKIKDKDKLVNFDAVSRYGWGYNVAFGTNVFDSGKDNLSEEIFFNIMEISLNATGWLSFQLGLNCKWDRFVASSEKFVSRDDDGDFKFVDVSTVKDPAKEYTKFRSQVNLFSLALPLAADLHFGKLYVRGGAEAILPVSAASKSVLKYDGLKDRTRLSGGKTADVLYDFFGEVYFDDIGLYVKYCPGEIVPGTGMSHLTIGVVAQF